MGDFKNFLKGKKTPDKKKRATKGLIETGADDAQVPDRSTGSSSALIKAGTSDRDAGNMGQGTDSFAHYAEVAEKNPTSPIGKNHIKVVFASDGTGSMSWLINNTKESIRMILQRISEDHKGAKITIQLVIFRDYFKDTDCNNPEELKNLFQSSDASTDHQYLENWLAEVNTHGGGDNREAIEFALKKILAMDDVDVVILSGDAPAHSKKELEKQNPQDTRTATEIATLFKKKNIPIHTFRVGNYGETKINFQDISQTAGGQYGELDGSDNMLDMAAMAILDLIGGEAAVGSYIAKYKPKSEAAHNFGGALMRFRKDNPMAIKHKGGGR